MPPLQRKSGNQLYLNLFEKQSLMGCNWCNWLMKNACSIRNLRDGLSSRNHRFFIPYHCPSEAGAWDTQRSDSNIKDDNKCCSGIHCWFWAQFANFLVTYNRVHWRWNAQRKHSCFTNVWRQWQASMVHSPIRLSCGFRGARPICPPKKGIRFHLDEPTPTPSKDCVEFLARKKMAKVSLMGCDCNSMAGVGLRWVYLCAHISV